MSSGIMERNLPVAESLGSGDKVRIVTSAGNSKQIDASQIGGGGGMLIAEVTAGKSDKTYNEIVSAIQNGIIPFMVDFDAEEDIYYISHATSYMDYEGTYTVELLSDYNSSMTRLESPSPDVTMDIVRDR